MSKVHEEIEILGGLMKIQTMERKKTCREAKVWGSLAKSGRKVSAKGFLRFLIIALIFISLLPSLSLGAQGGNRGQDPRLLRIAADLAAGTDIAVIIRNAVDAGLSVEKAVESLITAGADPGRVVYLAIAAHYPAEKVLKGAFTAVKKMGLSDIALQEAVNTIVSVALQAGATESQVNSAAMSAGIPAAVIANAIAEATSNPSPVFGYKAPGANTTSIVGNRVGAPGAGSFIGGSGIGAPPTDAATHPASPYNP